jgi:hypothetical protein
MESDFLEQRLVMLKVASTGMEAQDAHEYSLIIGQVGHSLDILNLKFESQCGHAAQKTQFIQVHTSTYQYVLIYTSMYCDTPVLCAFSKFQPAFSPQP